MDVELLSKIIGELIVDHDRVGLPGIGTFFAEVVPASFSDRGYTINPPYRRLSFYPNRTEDSLLFDFYAQTNGISTEAAKSYLSQFLAEMKTVLKDRKTIVFPGLGRMRATRENNFFFVPDQELDIYPEGFGLAPVSLRSHQEAAEAVAISVPFPASTPTQQSSPVDIEEEPDIADRQVRKVAEDKIIEWEPENGAVEVAEAGESVEKEVIVEVAETGQSVEAEEIVEVADAPKAVEPQRYEASGVPDGISEVLPAAEEEPVRRHSRWWIPVVSVCSVAVIALVAFLILAHVAPDLVDSILYTPEQLEIINY